MGIAIQQGRGEMFLQYSDTLADGSRGEVLCASCSGNRAEFNNTDQAFQVTDIHRETIRIFIKKFFITYKQLNVINLLTRVLASAQNESD